MRSDQPSLFAAEDVAAPPKLPWNEAPELAFSRWVLDTKSPRDGLPYTALSRQQFQSMWGQYCAFLRQREHRVLGATPGVLQAFLEQHRNPAGHGLAPVTVRRYLALLNRVYLDLVRQGRVTQNPVAQLWNQHRRPLAPAAVAHLPDSLDRRFVERVTALPERSWKQLRDKTLLLLLPGSGLTQGEILRLTEADLHLGERDPYLVVPARGRRDARAVSLSTFAFKALEKWLQWRQETGLRTTELFPAKSTGGALNPSTLYRHIRTLLSELGITEQKGARRLRHTFALRQLNAGAPEAAVKDWLGLETDEMLQRYRKLVPNRYGVTAV